MLRVLVLKVDVLFIFLNNKIMKIPYNILLSIITKNLFLVIQEFNYNKIIRNLVIILKDNCDNDKKIEVNDRFIIKTIIDISFGIFDHNVIQSINDLIIKDLRVYREKIKSLTFGINYSNENKTTVS